MRPRLRVVMLAAGAFGAALMLAFESPVTRAIGVIALFTFIAAGVFVIADPEFLGADDEPDDPATGPRAPADPPRA